MINIKKWNIFIKKFNYKIVDFTRVSKTMSYILRHSNIETDDNGYIDIDILLNHQDLKKYKITFDIIKNIVDNKFIRANQGHSNDKKS